MWRVYLNIDIDFTKPYLLLNVVSPCKILQFSDSTVKVIYPCVNRQTENISCTWLSSWWRRQSVVKLHKNNISIEIGKKIYKFWPFILENNFNPFPMNASVVIYVHWFHFGINFWNSFSDLFISFEMKHSPRTLIWEMGFAMYASSISFDRPREHLSSLKTFSSKTISNLFELNTCHFVGTSATQVQPTKFKR